MYSFFFWEENHCKIPFKINEKYIENKKHCLKNNKNDKKIIFLYTILLS